MRKASNHLLQSLSCFRQTLQLSLHKIPMSLMYYWSIFMGEKYLFKKLLVHCFHVVILFSSNARNHSRAIQFREKGNAQSLMYSADIRLCLTMLVSLMNFHRCCIGSSWATPLNRLFFSICRSPCLKSKVTHFGSSSGKIGLVSPKVGVRQSIRI